MAKLSEMIKPSLEKQSIDAIIDATLDRVENFGDIRLRSDNDDDVQDDDFGSQLAISVDYLRRAKDYLGYFMQVNDHSEFMGENATDALKDLVEELEDFLGDYDS